MNQPNLLSVNEAIRQMQAGNLSAEKLLDACLDQVERLNPSLNAFITLAPEVERSKYERQSRRKDRTVHAVEPPNPERLLEGIPVAAKDLFETAGIRTTGGSLFLKDYVPSDDATVIKRLKRAGAMVIGKTNTHEIALGVTTQNPHFGACHNPWDDARIPGGSSGGSAVAVSTGMALAGLGTDTGGSIRIPASLCGVIGLKPTYGRVSVRGVIPLSWNLDHVGPLTNTVEDAALLLQLMSGYDADDPWSVDRAVDDYRADIGKGVKGWRFALGAGEYVASALPEIIDGVARAARVLEDEGAVIEEVDVSYLREAALANGIMTQADGAAFHRDRLAEHPEWFGEDVRRRLEAGRSETSTDYSLARRTQSEMKRRLEHLFEGYDVLMLPTTPITAPLILGDDALEQARHLARFTAPFNLTGVPAISLPCGLHGGGLPMGLQMVTQPWQEARLLRAAFAYERASGEVGSRPPVAST
jgi:aspartyl-tRNA(Asn)/glutamyl-tRNA(Gln) amidotransferase subunit A